MSRNSDVDCGLVCPEFRGIFAYMSRAGLPIVGRLMVGHVRAGHAVMGHGVESIFPFLKEFEIALYFNF